MSTHATLRTDVFDAASLVEKRMKVLIPGDRFAEDPSDYRIEEIAYIDPESIRLLVDDLAEMQRASTLAPAKDATSEIFEDVFSQHVGSDDVLYAANPDDPASPRILVIGAGSATVVWKYDGSTVLTSGVVNIPDTPFATLTDVGGEATLTFTGAAYTAGDGIAIDGSNVISTRLASSSGLTYASGDLLVDEGYGLALDGNSLVADCARDTHLATVDSVSFAYSTDPQAQIGILWHEIAGYDGTKYQLLGQAQDTTKPTIKFDEVYDWLKTLPDWVTATPLLIFQDTARSGEDIGWSSIDTVLRTVDGYSGGATQLLGHVSGTFHFKTIAEWLNLLTGYVSGNDQSIGHDASDDTEWQDDTSTCP